jgi:hypothetical protein
MNGSEMERLDSSSARRPSFRATCANWISFLMRSLVVRAVVRHVLERLDGVLERGLHRRHREGDADGAERAAEDDDRGRGLHDGGDVSALEDHAADDRDDGDEESGDRQDVHLGLS